MAESTITIIGLIWIGGWSLLAFGLLIYGVTHPSDSCLDDRSHDYDWR